MSQILKVQGILSYPAIFDKVAPMSSKPGEKAGEPRYELQVSFAGDSQSAQSFKKAWFACITEASGKPTDAMWEKALRDRLSQYGLNDDKRTDAEGNPRQGFPKGGYYIKPNSQNRPVVVDQGRIPLTKEDGKPYAGCIVNVSMDMYRQKDSGAVLVKLRAVQLVREGERFGGSGSPVTDDEFSVIAEDLV